MKILDGLKGAVRGAGQAIEERVAREKARKASPDYRPEGWMFCKACGHEGNPARKTPGSLLIELVLWLFLIVPGLVYSLWRLSRRHDACQVCGSADIIPCDSPMARSMRKQITS